jgi:hypothetical protein
MKPKTFTTSMNRKVCWEDGFDKCRIKILDKLRKFREQCLCLEFEGQEDINLFNDYYEELEKEFKK